jgi:hypothetical protein
MCIFVIFKAAIASQWGRKTKGGFLALTSLYFSNFETFSIFKQFSVAKIQIFSFKKEKCLSVWRYDKNISIF